MIRVMLLAACLLLPWSVMAEDPPSPSSANDQASRSKTANYQLQITELQVPLEFRHDSIDWDDVLASLGDAKPTNGVELVEEIRLSIIPESESTVQIGKTVAIVNGFTSTRGGEREPHYIRDSIGTIVNASLNQNGEHLLLRLNYECSRLENATTDKEGEHHPASKIQSTVKTALRPTLGKAECVKRTFQNGQGHVLLVRIIKST